MDRSKAYEENRKKTDAIAKKLEAVKENMGKGVFPTEKEMSDINDEILEVQAEFGAIQTEQGMMACLN